MVNNASGEQLEHYRIALSHTLKALAFRKRKTALVIVALTLGLYLLFSFMSLKKQLVTTLNQYTLTTDLIISAQTPPLPLVLYALFQLGEPPQSMAYSQLSPLLLHPEINRITPVALGETHRGVPVIGTSLEAINQLDQLEMTRSAQSNPDKPEITSMVAYLGSEAAEKLGYQTGDQITIGYGPEPGAPEEYPAHFTIAGHLSPTSNLINQSIVIPLAGLAQARQAFSDRPDSPPVSGGSSVSSHSSHKQVWRHPDDISMVLVTLRDRMGLLAMEQALTDQAARQDLSITTALPARELQNLKPLLDRAMAVLITMALLVLTLGIVMLYFALTANLKERQQEMTLYRTLGMNRGDLWLMTLLEPILIVVAATLLALVLHTLLLPTLNSSDLSQWFVV